TLTTNVASDFVAMIDWGDGTTSAGTISGSGGAFSVSGSHTYAQGGQYTVDALVADDAPGTASGEVQSSASVGLFDGTGASFTEPERTAVNAPNIANFADGNTADTAAAFTATIDWGDGTTTPGDVIGSNGSFLVVGPLFGHAYADEGHFTTTTIVTRTADSSTLTITGTATANEADNLHV